VALTASATAPSARRAEEARDPLGADTTGRGAWVGTLALAIERAKLPYFVRLDAGLSLPLPFRRADSGAWQRYGVGGQAALAGGRELAGDRLVLAVQALLDAEAAYALDGVAVPDSGRRGLALALSAALRVAHGWTLTAALSSDALAGLVGARNRTERWSLALGVRHALQD
jgi:hypothetical protein